MEGSEIRIRPSGRLDAEMAETITRLIASARTAGTEPILDVSGLAAADRHAAVAHAQVMPASVA